MYDSVSLNVSVNCREIEINPQRWVLPTANHYDPLIAVLQFVVMKFQGKFVLITGTQSKFLIYGFLNITP